MSQTGYRRVVIHVPPSRDLMISVGNGLIESIPRVTRLTPKLTALAEVVPTEGTAPVSGSPLATADPNPSRALALYVEPQTPLEDLRCFIPRALEADVVLDLSRALFASGSSCAVGSRHEIACALGRVAGVRLGHGHHPGSAG